MPVEPTSPIAVGYDHTIGLSGFRGSSLHHGPTSFGLHFFFVLRCDVQVALVVRDDRSIGVVTGPEPEDARGAAGLQALMSHPARATRVK
jgi:hypothetical protein